MSAKIFVGEVGPMQIIADSLARRLICDAPNVLITGSAPVQFSD